jgi:tetratricopeptide (TPR) repeat protein
MSTISKHRGIKDKAWFLFISLLVLAGCSSLPNNQDQTFTEPVSANPINQPASQLTRARRQQLRDQTAALAEARQWAKAFRLLQPVLNNLPTHDPLQQYANSLEQQYQNDIFVAKINETLAYSRWLVTAIQLQSFWIDSASTLDLWQRMKYRNLLADQQTTANDLIQLGLHALKLNYISLAEQCYQAVVDSIKENNQITVDHYQLERLAKSLEQLENERQEQRLQQLQIQLNNALTARNWITVRELIDELKQQEPIEAGLQEKIRLAEKDLARRAASLNRRAASLYRTGKIAEAKEEWQLALVLKPDNNEIKENLSRATKVLNSLTRLRQNSEDKVNEK